MKPFVSTQEQFKNGVMTCDYALAAIRRSLPPAVVEAMQAHPWYEGAPGLAKLTPEYLAERRKREDFKFMPHYYGRDDVEFVVMIRIIGWLSWIVADSDIDLSAGDLESWAGRLDRRLGATNGARMMLGEIADRVLWGIVHAESDARAEAAASALADMANA